jgi:hypothetical protein
LRNDHSSSTTPRATGFRTIACLGLSNFEPSSSLRGSGTGSSFLSQGERTSSIQGLARDLDVLRLLRQKNSKVARMSNAPTAAPTPTPDFAPVDNPLLGMFLCVGVAVGVTVVVTVAVLLLGGELVLEADTEELAAELGEAPPLLLLLAAAELVEEPEADEAEALPVSVATKPVWVPVAPWMAK